MNLDTEWLKFLNNDVFEMKITNDNCIPTTDNIPKCGEIYISTKTKILFLNQHIDINSIFWKLPVTDYNTQEEGIIKKQIKMSNDNKPDLENIFKQLSNYTNVHCKILSQMENDTIFKDVRKISIGICKKDLLYTRNKEKSAFYNCFVIVLRIKRREIFKEIHVKIFNTGKVEIPGIQEDSILDYIMTNIIKLLKTIIDPSIDYNRDKIENVLINSNFHCGFYINREILYNTLRNKYNINAIYDPCSYPGIRCIYYYTNENDIAIKISYMIFRTGSILIVGKCDEFVLNIVYEYIKCILKNEYKNIYTEGSITKITKIKKLKKKFIYVT
jgi:TATA-box binding protein (TBP) (component of TFIID and TFIIIB)